jgi:heme/copper-type cytochrome/quinol oxidase subunit 4
VQLVFVRLSGSPNLLYHTSYELCTKRKKRNHSFISLCTIDQILVCCTTFHMNSEKKKREIILFIHFLLHDLPNICMLYCTSYELCKEERNHLFISLCTIYQIHVCCTTFHMNSEKKERNHSFISLCTIYQIYVCCTTFHMNSEKKEERKSFYSFNSLCKIRGTK